MASSDEEFSFEKELKEYQPSKALISYEIKNRGDRNCLLEIVTLEGVTIMVDWSIELAMRIMSMSNQATPKH